jgi:hypothetical protein
MSSTRVASFALIGALALAPIARAADVTATLPVVTAAPGASVPVPITVSGSLVPFGVMSIQLQMPINPTYVSNASWNSSGLVTTWGAPFTNTTSTLTSLATFGATAIASSSTDLATVTLTVSPSAPSVADVPLTLSLFRLNGTTPTTAVLSGVLRIRSGSVDVPEAGASGLSLAPPAPCPATHETMLAFTLPADAGAAPARLVIYGVDGRRVRTLASGVSAPGTHVARWDVRDERGARVGPGISFARLELGGRGITRRVPVTN